MKFGPAYDLEKANEETTKAWMFSSSRNLTL
jgi:hypothetical protein